MPMPQTTIPAASGSGMNAIPTTVDTMTPFVVTYQLGMNVFHSKRFTKKRTKNTATWANRSASIAKNTILNAVQAPGAMLAP